jgi:hypothetical protein
MFIRSAIPESLRPLRKIFVPVQKSILTADFADFADNQALTLVKQHCEPATIYLD